jgi:hypothetical protein
MGVEILDAGVDGILGRIERGGALFQQGIKNRIIPVIEARETLDIP